MARILNIYTSANVQGILCKAVAYLYANPLNTWSGKGNSGSLNNVTNQDMKGLSTGQIATLVTNLIAAGALYDELNICVPTATSTATNTLTYDQVAALDQVLKTGVRGVVNNIVHSGTAASNSTVTNIVLDASASTVNDFYKGDYIVTAGVTAVYRLITGYTGSTKTATVVTTGTAITTTGTFIIYTSPLTNIVGNASTTLNACYEAWATLFPDQNIPLLISLMGGYSTPIFPHYMVTLTATGVTANTLSDTSNFTAEFARGTFDNGNFYVAIESATTGAGQIKRILSCASASQIIIEPWDVLPTGTIIYQISNSQDLALNEFYLPYAIMTYLNLDTAQVNQIFQQLLDKDNVIPGGGLKPLTNLSTLNTYAQRGKAVFDAVCAGIVS